MIIQNKKSWCRDNSISEKPLYYWQRILRNETYIERKQQELVMWNLLFHFSFDTA